MPPPNQRARLAQNQRRWVQGLVQEMRNSQAHPMEFCRTILEIFQVPEVPDDAESSQGEEPNSDLDEGSFPPVSSSLARGAETSPKAVPIDRAQKPKEDIRACFTVPLLSGALDLGEEFEPEVATGSPGSSSSCPTARHAEARTADRQATEARKRRKLK